MSIASEITRIQGNIADAYTQANAKGATMPATQNSDNLASTIATISTGVTPTGSISITSNGTYDVTDKAEAVVNVPTTAPALYREFQLNANGILIPNKTTTHIMDFTGMTDVSDYALYRAYLDNTAISGVVDISDLTGVTGGSACCYMFQGCRGLTGANLSALTTISGSNGCSNMFNGCTGLISFDLSALTAASGYSACAYMFNGCTGITSANLPALTTVYSYACQNMFTGCTGLTSANLSALTTINGANGCSNMFNGCTGLISADLSSLTTVSASNACQHMFDGCTSLTTVYIGGTAEINFGTNTNQFNGMFQNCTQNIDVYAPAANQTAIESFSGYPNFGATGNVVWHWRS